MYGNYAKGMLLESTTFYIFEFVEVTDQLLDRV